MIELQVPQEIRNSLVSIVEAITPFDDKERQHKAQAIEWISSSAQLYRIESPATPAQHLVCYIVLVDREAQMVLLGAHKKAGLLLPSGGHLDPLEAPWDAAKREAQEELGSNFDPLFGKNPFFISIVEAIGIAPTHVDVDLWYVLRADSSLGIPKGEEFDTEFASASWLSFREILALKDLQTDPNMHRFIGKLAATLEV